MFSKLTPYASPVPARSSLLKGPPESVPPVDELEALQLELKLLKTKTMERAKKAGEDLKSIEESLRRIKDREKGKAKAHDRIKREHASVTPLPEHEESRLPHLHASSSKSRPPSMPSTSVAGSNRASLDPRRMAIDDLKKKKKKRKREVDDSDAESEIQRPVVTISHPPALPSKLAKAIPSISKTPIGPDFTVPISQPLLPARPPVPPPPIPGPSKPTEVMEDFSKVKQPAQTVVSTFYASIEPFLRNIKEEDVGFLEYTGDEVEPFIMPKLGRLYTEVWEEEDMAQYGQLLPGVNYGRRNLPSPTLSTPPVPKWDPSTLMEPDLQVEEKGHGPLTERLVSALLPMPDQGEWKGVKAAEDAMEGRPGGYGAAAAKREKVNVSDLETRIGETMRFHGLLDGVPDYSGRVDDPIATALRHAQSELRTVLATNKARRARLAAIARDRLGYQEYLDLRDSLDKNITGQFGKLQKKDVPKLNKKKKKGHDLNGHNSTASANGNGTPAPPPPCPAALGFNPDDENRLMVSEQLIQLVKTRRQWVDTVGGVFEEKEREMPGRIYGLPKKSVFDGIEEEVRRQVERSLVAAPASSGSGSTGRTNNLHDKGKAKAAGDEMDVG